MQLEEVGAYIALESLEAARLLVRKVMDKADRLAFFPGAVAGFPNSLAFPNGN